MITERQKQILGGVVQEYIDLAEPISSELLDRKYDFGICPATIRIEMQKLTDKGYLCQPHTSAGRLPTDKGYRFFVDELLKLEDFEEDFSFDWDTRVITKFLATESSNLALGYLSTERILWKEGWKEVLREPEFEEAGLAVQFAQFLDDFENNIESIFVDFPSEIQVYIGKENPVSGTRDFSIITSKFILPGEERIFALLGPKRMSYSKNISLLNNLANLLK